MTDTTDPGAALFSPSAERNTAPIQAVLDRVLPLLIDRAAGDGRRARVLEIAAGTGQHAVAFAAAYPGCDWLPSDPDAAARASIVARAAASGLATLHAPRALDAAHPDWPDGVPAPIDAIIAVNLLHISPWAVTLGLLSGAARVLAPGGAAVTYGCFRRDGAHVSASNAAFDADLRARDPAWGVRDAGAVVTAAEAAGLAHEETVAMPANNTVLILRQPNDPARPAA